MWLPLCINSAQVARDTVPVDTNVDESTLKSTSMVLVSVELQKNLQPVNVDKIRTVPKVSIKMNRALKNPFFFTKSRLMDFYVTS